jgi:hypothetical protein
MMSMTRWWYLAVAVLGLMGGAGGPARASQVLTNGDFEAGGGSFTGWTVLDQPGGSGSWFIQSGTGSPLNGFPVPPPPGPANAAMTDQGGPGSHVLYQDFLVPTAVSSGTLMFDRFIGNQAGDFFSPDSLDSNVSPNQQARVDILTTTADPFSVAAGDVLLNLFQTMPGDPLVSGYTNQSNDLTAFLTAHEGQTLRLRFAEADNQLFFNFGVDRVSLDVTTGVSAVPEPSTLISGGIACLFGLGYGWRRRKAKLAA